MLGQDDLSRLVDQIIECRDAGVSPGTLLAEFEAAVPYPRARELFLLDHDAAYILARATGFRRVEPGEGQRAELEELVRRIRRFEGGELGVDIALDSLRASVPHPAVSRLVGDTSLSEQQVIDAALAYEGVRL